MTPEHEKAADLLELIWRGIATDYKSRYRMTIWQQFEDQVRSAAYTSRLGTFINMLCLKLQAGVGTRAEDREKVNGILNGGQDRALLKLIRDETTLLVLMVRIRNQERQDEWRDRQAEREEQEHSMHDPLFGLSEEKV